jgi:hypothetical protein
MKVKIFGKERQWDNAKVFITTFVVILVLIYGSIALFAIINQ